MLRKVSHIRDSRGRMIRGRRYSRHSRWPYILGLGLILTTSFYFFGPFNRGVVGEETPVLGTKEEPKPKPKAETATLIADMEAYLGQQTGTYAYTVIELDDGRQFGSRDSAYYTAASSIKVAIYAYLYHQIEAGVINPESRLTYTSADYETGTGSLQADPIGSKYKISYLAERMIKVSDNVATNILIRHLGRTNIQRYLDSQGLSEIKIATNDVTPRGMAKLLKLIYDETLLTKENKELLFDYMKKSITPERLVAGVPKTIEVAHKIGSWSGAMSDIGIVFTDRPYAIAVYTDGVAWGAVTDSVIAGINRKVYEFEGSF